jgi:hypothetical protein
MDMVFRDDECRLRTDHAPTNFTTIKQIALNLMRRGPGKDSLRLRRKVGLERHLPRKAHRKLTFARFPCE